MVSLMKELNMRVQLRVATDSTANIGIQHRVGVGKMRHLEIRSLWLQEALRNGRFTLVKRSTVEMRGDLMTKYHSSERMKTLLGMLHVKLIAAATLVPAVAAADTVIVTQGTASGSVFDAGTLAWAVLTIAAFGAGYFVGSRCRDERKRNSVPVEEAVSRASDHAPEKDTQSPPGISAAVDLRKEVMKCNTDTLRCYLRTRKEATGGDKATLVNRAISSGKGPYVECEVCALRRTVEHSDTCGR